jgi:cytochrome c-type biogenesis protein CcmE
MIARQRRMIFVGLIVLGVGGASALGLQAFRENMSYYVTPTELLADAKAAERTFRLGGFVKQGSVQRTQGSMDMRFVVTDFEHELSVAYNKVLPDLFREGQGVIARGKMEAGVFRADEVLAKHDENYMPPEMAEKIKQQHGGQMPVAKDTE